MLYRYERYLPSALTEATKANTARISTDVSLILIVNTGDLLQIDTSQ